MDSLFLNQIIFGFIIFGSKIISVHKILFWIHKNGHTHTFVFITIYKKVNVPLFSILHNSWHVKSQSKVTLRIGPLSSLIYQNLKPSQYSKFKNRIFPLFTFPLYVQQKKKLEIGIFLKKKRNFKNKFFSMRFCFKKKNKCSRKMTNGKSACRGKDFRPGRVRCAYWGDVWWREKKREERERDKFAHCPRERERTNSKRRKLSFGKCISAECEQNVNRASTNSARVVLEKPQPNFRWPHLRCVWTTTCLPGNSL